MKRKRLWWGGLMIVSGCLFIGLLSGVLTHSRWIAQLDMLGNAAISSANGVRLFYTVVSIIASPLITCLIVCVLCGVIGVKTQWKWGLSVGGMFLMGDALALLVKEIVRRPRPRLAVDHGFSFPSGHVFVTTLLVLGILIYLGHYGQFLGSERRFGIALAAVCWAVIVALSRVALHAHYLSDVIASGLLGIWWTSLGEFLWSFSRPIKRTEEK